MNAATANGQLDITILVKALNEEQHIEACLRSAQAALAGVPELTGEVLLADSVSTDRTVDIALGLGVRVVQFENAADRNCGATLQLGYQYALGRYLYVLDGDMQMVPGFLARAYRYLQENPAVAGVGGKLIDVHVRTAADRQRTSYYGTLAPEQVVHSLGGGGLYRRAAIDGVGYLANRWLPAFEEADLAVRLRAAGYQLVRLGEDAIMHSGHAESSGQMLRRLWRNGRIRACGMFLRSALGRPWFVDTARGCWFIFAAPALYAIGALLALAAAQAGMPWPVWLAVPLVVWGAALALLAWRKRSIGSALVGAASWHLYTLGAIRGFLAAPGDPLRTIAAREISTAVRATAAR